MKEKVKDFNSMTLNLPLRPLCAVTVKLVQFAWYAEMKSFSTMQRSYRRVLRGDAPHTKTTKSFSDKL